MSMCGLFSSTLCVYTMYSLDLSHSRLARADMDRNTERPAFTRTIETEPARAGLITSGRVNGVLETFLYRATSVVNSRVLTYFQDVYTISG